MYDAVRGHAIEIHHTSMQFYVTTQNNTTTVKLDNFEIKPIFSPVYIKI